MLAGKLSKRESKKAKIGDIVVHEQRREKISGSAFSKAFGNRKDPGSFIIAAKIVA